MTATATMIATVRRSTAEPLSTNYDDDLISAIIEQFPMVDALGSSPFTWDFSTTPPTEDANEDWIVTYDLNSAAAQIWYEKAALLQGNFNFSVDGGKYDRSQAYDNAMRQARQYQARRAIRLIVQIPDTDIVSDPNGVVN